MKKIASFVLWAGLVTGCTALPQHPVSPFSVAVMNQPVKECEALTSDQELIMVLAGELAGAGKLHAALANLERLPVDLPQAQLRKAQILRMLGRSEARALYQRQLKSCLAAEAHHGLGQLAVADMDYDAAVKLLDHAVRLSPNTASMRNDLGVAYLNLGRINDARFELMTALELSEADDRPAQNLLTLYLYENEWGQARELVGRQQLTVEQFRDAENRARTLREIHQPGTVSVSPPSASDPAALESATEEGAAPVVSQEKRRVQQRASGETSRPADGEQASRVAVPASVAGGGQVRNGDPAQSERTQLEAMHSAPSSKIQRVESRGTRPVVPILGGM